MRNNFFNPVKDLFICSYNGFMGFEKVNYLLMSCSSMQVEQLSDKIDAVVEPVIEELED
jgi:hypothetical protein